MCTTSVEYRNEFEKIKNKETKLRRSLQLRLKRLMKKYPEVTTLATIGSSNEVLCDNLSLFEKYVNDKTPQLKLFK